MALLQCCFESAEYVELLHTHDPHDDHDAESAGEPQISKRETVRPPRSLSGIFGAVVTVILNMALGAVVGQQLWLLLRSRSANWCHEAPHFMDLGVHAMHLGKAAHSAFCNGLRNAPGVEAGVAVAFASVMGPLALRIVFGKAYFTSWTDLEELQELQRLYCVRSRGTSLVLHSWRFRVVVMFIFDIVIWMWFRYYLDLYLDVQAMEIFAHNNQWQFFTCNLLGIVLGLCWTAVEFYKALRESDSPAWSSLPGEQVLLVGVCLPLAGLHMTYLAIVSLAMGCKHRFLYISALAEAILESAVSAFVQTYAVVFSHLNMADRMDLYSSIALSFVSIGFAFSSLDKIDGGELLVHLPGFCRSSSLPWWIVFMFRVAEVSSRATSLALFQRVWRPYGLFAAVGIDTVIVMVVAAIFQYHRGRFGGKGMMELLRSNIVYALPSVVCLMTPMLEKDTPLTVPPGFYYSLRIFELGVMAGLMGWKLNWSLEAAEQLFYDDALVVATFAFSTVLMIILGIYLRHWLALRVLLEAPMEAWCERPFTMTQQVLRNRILLGGGSTIKFAHFNLQELGRIMKSVASGATRYSWQVRAVLAEEGSEYARNTTHLEWDALFLAAKMSSSVDRSLKALEDAFAKHRRTASEASISSGNTRSTKQALAGVLHGERPGRHREVRLGSLVSLGGKGGCMTISNNRIEMRFPHDRADQKFVIEPADDVPFGETALSGSVVRLRALESGHFVALSKPDGGSFNLELRPLAGGSEDTATVFTLFVSHEEEYRTAQAFAKSIELGSDGLMVTKLVQSGKASAEGSPQGWRIVSINGKIATREMVADLMDQGKDDIESEISSHAHLLESPNKDKVPTPTPRSKGTCSSLSRTESPIGKKKLTCYSILEGHASRARSIDECGTPASSVEHYKVRFEKVFGKDMKVRFGDKVALRSQGVPGAIGAPVALQRSTDSPGTSHPLHVAAGVPAATFVLDDVELGSRDESGLYQWVATEIQRRVFAMELQSALPKKLKNAIVVSYNARTDLPGIGVLFQNRGLHLHLLQLLNNLLCGYRVIELQYESRDEIFEELCFSSDGNRPLVVEAVDGRSGTVLSQPSEIIASGNSYMSTTSMNWLDGKAAAAGLRAGDELLEVEANQGGTRNRLLRFAPEIRAALRIGGGADQGGSEDTLGTNESFNLIFQTPCSVDSGVQEVAISNALMIAQLLPGWEAIIKVQKEEASRPVPCLSGDVCIFRFNELFRLKCRLVTSMLQSGWELRHTAFADDAVSLHEHFDAFTLAQLESLLPGKDAPTCQLRERILVAQLDVLTASWAAVPRTVKEHRPEVLQKLFRSDCELLVMLDGLKIVYRTWQSSTQCGLAFAEMPRELQNFIERVRPVSEAGVQGVLGSMAWIMKAWSSSDQKEANLAVQRIVNEFTSIHSACERYWLDMLKGAADAMEETQANLERSLATADVRVVLVSPENARRELGQLQQQLTDDHLVLTSSFKPTSDSDVVPQGHRLIRRGHLSEHFGSDTSDQEIHRRLLELVPSEDDESDLRLLFSGDDYNSSCEEASRAIEELGAIIRVVKSSARAFPDTVLPQSRALLEKHHHGELKSVTLENRRRIQVQEREAQEMVRTANMRLSYAESQKMTAQRKLTEAEEQKVLAEVAKVDAENRAQKVLELYETLQHVKERLEAEKSQLQNDQSGWMKTRELMEKDQQRLKSEKLELESEKNEWTVARKAMEQEKQHLQEDILKAKGERKRLEEAAEKWQKTLVSVKAEAEEKEHHLKEIQSILQKAPTSSAASASASATFDNSSLPPTDTKPNQRVLMKGRTTHFSSADNIDVEPKVPVGSAHVQEAPVLQQLWAVMSKAFGAEEMRKRSLSSRSVANDVAMTQRSRNNSLGGA